MMPEIFGNEPVLQLIRTMAEKDRIPHACLIYGDKGMGRKTVARYLAMTALCTGENAPCGGCPSCRKLQMETEDTFLHPDFIRVEHSGKKGGFSVETVRAVCKDTIVAPNDGERKVYLFADCDSIDPRAQNTLLKLTEEPPPHVLLLFTAVSRNVFLETMLSRMMPLAVLPCTPEECRQALTEQHGIAPHDADKAVTACGGNIGRALAWLEDENMQEMTKQLTAVSEAIAAGNQYEVLRILAQYEKDRQNAAEFLRLLDVQIRDAAAMKCGQESRRQAVQLGNALTVSRCIRMHESIQTAYEALQASVSTKLVLAALGGSLMDRGGSAAGKDTL